MKLCQRSLIAILVLLLCMLGIQAQWIQVSKNKSPRYLFFARNDGTYSLVRFKDWAEKIIRVPEGPSTRAYFMGVMPDQPIIVALVPHGDPEQKYIDLEVINLETGKSVCIHDPEKQTHIARYLNMVFMRPGDNDHVYVLFSNSYDYGSAEYAFTPDYEKGSWIMALLDPSTMKWTRMRKPLNYAELFAIPGGGDSYIQQEARKNTKGRATRQTWNSLIKNLKAASISPLLKDGVIKITPSERVNNILHLGQKYQVVCRGEESKLVNLQIPLYASKGPAIKERIYEGGTFALVRTENGKSAILSECSESRAKQLGFVKDLYQLKDVAVTALISQKLSNF